MSGRDHTTCRVVRFLVNGVPARAILGKRIAAAREGCCERVGAGRDDI
jgi:hypothetical protein